MACFSTGTNDAVFNFIIDTLLIETPEFRFDASAVVRVDDARTREVRAWQLSDDRQNFIPVLVNGSEHVAIEAEKS